MEYSSETEQKIIRAATDIFLQKGKDGARMQEIARQAGINQALLHYYFRSKEKLYRQVFVSEVREFMEAIFHSMVDKDDIAEFVRSFIYRYIDQLAQNPQVIRFILWEIERGGSLFAEVFREIITQNPGKSPSFFIRKLNDAIRQGKIRKLDPHHLIFSIIGMCIYVFLARPLIQQIFPEINFTSPEFIEKRKEEVFNLVWNGIKP